MDNDNLQLKQTNISAYILGTLLTVSLGVMGYVYSTKDIVKKGEIEEKYVLKEDVSFDTLPSYIQERYTEKYKCNNEEPTVIEKIVEKPIEIEKIVEKPVEVIKEVKVPCEPSVVEKIIEKPVEIIKEVKIPSESQVIEKIVEVEKKVLVKSDDLSKLSYKAFKCYDMGTGDIYPSKECIDGLNNFLDENKDAYKYEVIGVIDTKEFEIIEKIRTQENQKEINRISNLAQIGLSRKRVIEGFWAIKNHLGVDTAIGVVNYTITSKKGYKGFVVRAYK